MQRPGGCSHDAVCRLARQAAQQQAGAQKGGGGAGALATHHLRRLSHSNGRTAARQRQLHVPTKLHMKIPVFRRVTRAVLARLVYRNPRTHEQQQQQQQQK
eukprot:1143391-Pelagomonas_calceolata.AAC.11